LRRNKEGKSSVVFYIYCELIYLGWRRREVGGINKFEDLGEIVAGKKLEWAAWCI
jgi:hypothetical protein